MHGDTTRERILGLIVSAGPVSAAVLADELGVTPAGIRRHITALEADGLITDHDQPGPVVRGRGRPARSYVATAQGQRALTSAYADVAVDAVGYLRDQGDLSGFVEGALSQFEQDLAQSIPDDAPLPARVEALAGALAEKGFAPSVRPGPGGYTVQLCQGHCPVQSVAEAAPEWCEEETRVFSRLLDVHVQRLSTLAGGAHVCTTTIPLALASPTEGNA